MRMNCWRCRWREVRPRFWPEVGEVTRLLRRGQAAVPMESGRLRLATHECAGRVPCCHLLDLPDPFKPNQSLVFRTNRDRTVLNERNTGYVFNAYAQNPKVVLNWDDADDTDTETEKVDSDKDKVCKPGAELENPVSAGLRVGVRPARPMVLRVFEYEGVKVDKCDAGVVVPGPVSPAAERGQVNLIENGTALQITPLVNTGEFTVPYRIKGTAAESELAIITVRVVPDGA